MMHLVLCIPFPPAYAPRNPSSIFFFTSKMYNRRCIVCKRMRYTFAYAPKEWNGGSALCKEDAKNGACAKVYCMPFGGTHRRCERDQVHWYVVRRMGPGASRRFDQMQRTKKWWGGTNERWDHLRCPLLHQRCMHLSETARYVVVLRKEQGEAVGALINRF